MSRLKKVRYGFETFWLLWETRKAWATPSRPAKELRRVSRTPCSAALVGQIRCATHRGADHRSGLNRSGFGDKQLVTAETDDPDPPSSRPSDRASGSKKKDLLNQRRVLLSFWLRNSPFRSSKCVLRRDVETAREK